jgi:pyrroloquinoline quinone biosynthesis protein B
VLLAKVAIGFEKLILHDNACFIFLNTKDTRTLRFQLQNLVFAFFLSLIHFNDMKIPLYPLSSSVFTLFLLIFSPITVREDSYREGCVSTKTATENLPEQFIVVLGIAQDAGFPHPYCGKICCESVAKGKTPRQNVTCLGIVDRTTQQVFMVEATPDFTQQERILRGYLSDKTQPLSGVLLTHAHIGHYTGLMYLGREAVGAKATPVFAMPKMKSFLKTNGPWSQLVSLQNIKIQPLTADSSIEISKNIQIKPIVVPHRDEFSETVGYIISTARKRVLFIPDIDKWKKWQRDIRQIVGEVDVALLDGTFYKNGEIPNRDMSEIPHPFIEETIQLFEKSPEKGKIRFIHLNHTNPILRRTPERAAVLKQGFGICTEGEVIGL